MPFESKAQRSYLYANHPAVAREFQAATPKGAKLPEHVKSPRGPKPPRPSGMSLYRAPK
jgi:hypothetical protein